MADEQIDPVLGALRDLLDSEGWRVFSEAAMAEWGPTGYGRRMAEAIGSVPHGPDRPYELARVAEQTDATAHAVMSILRWPKEEMGRRSQQPVSMTTVRDRMVSAINRGRRS